MEEYPRAEVLYEYDAQDGDQLTIRPGEVVDIIEDSPELNGWTLARKGDQEGYVPREYVTYVDRADYVDQTTPQFGTTGFEQYMQNILYENAERTFCDKFIMAAVEVLYPFPCERNRYIFSNPEFRNGAILYGLFTLILTCVDAYSILAPVLPATPTPTKPTPAEIVIFVLNFLLRLLLTLEFIRRYCLPALLFNTFPLLNVICVFTFSFRIYEQFEMGHTKEYDGYRYYLSWMYCCVVNLIFNIALFVFISTGSGGSIVVPIILFAWNFLNAIRCWLHSWAYLDAGKRNYPDFDRIIHQYKL